MDPESFLPTVPLPESIIQYVYWDQNKQNILQLVYKPFTYDKTYYCLFSLDSLAHYVFSIS